MPIGVHVGARLPDDRRRNPGRNGRVAPLALGWRLVPSFTAERGRRYVDQSRLLTASTRVEVAVATWIRKNWRRISTVALVAVLGGIGASEVYRTVRGDDLRPRRALLLPRFALLQGARRTPLRP